MDRSRPIVIHTNEAPQAPGLPTPGMARRELLDDDERWVGWLRTTAGMAGGWHHHGERDSYIYVLRGSITIEFGPGGREHVRASAGDFIFNPRRIVHRETTGPDEPAEAFVVRVGSGPQNFNVDGPEPERGSAEAPA